VSRKVSVDSVSDTSADDLLRFLYDLTFRQPSPWGWVAAGCFAALPAWLAIVCMVEGNVIGSVVLLLMTGMVPLLRTFLLRRNGHRVFGKIEMPANDG
jgi:hypothetical protein